ncbi:MAG TPA: glucose 1-dehydrogenase [Candidatus Eisenbacteria bacterium]|nr:glucose 1-dehydrogenase [Candidatus Eisenbacteria bacterium]
MNGRLEGKVALVTGGSRGIGAATCVKMAREGASVVVADVIDGEGEALAASIAKSGGKARYVHLDVASEADWASAVRGTLQAFGALHVLVNNAGIASLEDVEQETLAGYQRILNVNQIGAWLGMKAAVPHLRAAGGGAIVNISSIYGAVGGNGGSIAYHATKGALRQMTKNAAIRYAPDKIRVVSVHPGFIETPMVAPFIAKTGSEPNPMLTFILEHTPLARMGRSEEVANVITFLASDEASYMTGSEVFVDGGWTAA